MSHPTSKEYLEVLQVIEIFKNQIKVQSYILDSTK